MEIKRCLTCAKEEDLHIDEFGAWQCKECQEKIEDKLNDIIIIR